VTSAGFENLRRDVSLKVGSNRLEVELEIAHLVEEVTVTRDPREAATDPGGETMAVTLGASELAALPNAPDDLAQLLQELAGPDAEVNVDGFRGGALPSREQIQEVRVRRALYSADSHRRGGSRVDIVTRPGTDRWQSSISFNFRDDALNARNAFATEVMPEQRNRVTANVEGPLVANRTSMGLEIDGHLSYESSTIRAAAPTGLIQGLVRQPQDELEVGARLFHALTRTHTMRLDYRHDHSDEQNLGVGDFDLPERAYARIATRQRLRIGSTAALTGSALNEFRLQVGWEEARSSPVSLARTIRVLDTLNSGGANIQGGRRERSVQLNERIDVRLGPHALAAGGQFDWLSYRSDEIRNPFGTYTFSTLADLEAGRPLTFTQRRGDPTVRYSMLQAAWFVQDDIRLRKNLSVGLGLRHEWQSHLDDRLNLAPRVGFSWAPAESGRTTVRGAAGIFYDWYEGSTYEETLQVDGIRVQDVTIQFPSYPDPPDAGDLILLPRGRVQQARDLRMPTIRQGTIAVEQRLPGSVRLNVGYTLQDGVHLLRGRNVNAPGPDGVRPDPAVGNVIEIRSLGREREHELTLGVSARLPWRRVFLTTRYAWQHRRNDGDGPLSLPANNAEPDEWGPARGDIRHQVTALGSLELPKRIQVGVNVRAESAPPYTITTGRDDNGDTEFNDRPAGVARNSARGEGALRVDLRLSWRVGVGRPADPAREQRSGRRDDSDGDWRSAHRVMTEFYVRAVNVLNTVNRRGFSGVLSSPFFGRPTSAQSARRLEIGTQVMF
jgi:hypothetical protein